MKKALIFLADGFEEIEAITPIDILKRGGVEVVSVGIGSNEIVGSHQIKMITSLTDKSFEENYFLSAEKEGAALKEFSLFILPGGMNGSIHLSQSKTVSKTIDWAFKNRVLVAAICAAPALVLNPLGVLKNQTVCCYPGFEKELDRSVCFSADDVAVTPAFITASGAGKAFDFALELLRALEGEEKANQIRKETLYSYEGKIRYFN